jgi:DNA-binding NtrC family response regulator
MSELLKEKIKILVIDDDVELQFMFSEFVRMVGHNYYSATNGEESIKLMKNNSYDLVFLDYNLEDKNGFEIYEIMEKENYNSKFVVMSGILELIKEEFKGKKNIIAFFEKPFSLENFREIVENVSNDSKKSFDMFNRNSIKK